MLHLYSTRFDNRNISAIEILFLCRVSTVVYSGLIVEIAPQRSRVNLVDDMWDWKEFPNLGTNDSHIITPGHFAVLIEFT